MLKSRSLLAISVPGNGLLGRSSVTWRRPPGPTGLAWLARGASPNASAELKTTARRIIVSSLELHERGPAQSRVAVEWEAMRKHGIFPEAESERSECWAAERKNLK